MVRRVRADQPPGPQETRSTLAHPVAGSGPIIPAALAAARQQALAVVARPAAMAALQVRVVGQAVAAQQRAVPQSA
jgi:hypothetical protein